MRGYDTDEPGYHVPGDDDSTKSLVKDLKQVFGEDNVFILDENSFPEEDAQDEEKDVHRALQLIVDHCDEKAVKWAVNYARYGLNLHGSALRTQVLYVLCNIQHWRGSVASLVRSVLKEYVGEK